MNCRKSENQCVAVCLFLSSHFHETEPASFNSAYSKLPHWRPDSQQGLSVDP